MSVLLGIVLGGVIFLWARECLGAAPAIAAVLFFALEPNLLAHFGLVATDASLACFVFATIYFAHAGRVDRTFNQCLLGRVALVVAGRKNAEAWNPTTARHC